MRGLVVGALLLASPAAADERTFAFLGALGCTVSEASRDALADAGFLEPYTNAIIDDALMRGVARQYGSYVVLDESVCTIRLPEITSRFSVDDPEVRALAPFIREEYSDGERIRVEEECFLEDPARAFTLFNGGAGPEGFNDFIAFIGAGIIAGDVRFYTTSPLVTPPGFQIVTGECAEVANIADIQASHAHIASHFGEYVRFVGANTVCGEPVTHEAGVFTAEMQGYDMDVDISDQPPVNAMLQFEFLFITMAAGWHAGMTGTDRGTPRPPLCHYPL